MISKVGSNAIPPASTNIPIFQNPSILPLFAKLKQFNTRQQIYLRMFFAKAYMDFKQSQDIDLSPKDCTS